MKKLRMVIISLFMSVALCVCSVGVHTQTSEAFIVGWLVKKAVKSVAKKAVVSAVKNNVVGKVKNAYKKKQKSFKVSSKSHKLYVGETVRLKPFVCYGNKIKWKSTKKSVASVSSNGVVKAKKAGVTYIKATPSISKKVSKIKITVKKRKTIYKSVTLEVDDEYLYEADSLIGGKSSKPSVADVEVDGYEGAYIVAYKAGTCKVTLVKSNGQKIIITVKVKKVAKPTKKPTATPTPTAEPTASPTPEPTIEPTMEPTPEPIATSEPGNTEE